jgi:hypothetical protein
MSVVDTIKRHGADKIALLALFVVALLLARLIIASRSAIALSGLIELNHSGLSVSVPAGNGWQSEKQWKYHKNTFTLSSFFDSGSGSMTAMARCRYLLAATTAAADTLFKEKASEMGGAIANTGQIRIDMPDSRFTKSSQNGAPLVINWVHIIRPKRLFDTFLGITKLPYGRQLNIEVYQAGGDTDLAERVFNRVTETVKLQDNRALEAGSEIVAAIKSKGLESFFGPHFAKETKEGGNFFLMKDKKGRSIGFAMDVLITAPVLQENHETETYDINPDAKSIQAASFHYIREPLKREQATFFQGQNNLDEFTWKSETSGIEGRSGAEIVLDKTAVITVRKFGKTIEDSSYQLNSVAIPNIFSDLTFIQMLNSSHEEIIMDIIDADGDILPLLVSKIDKDDSTIRQFFSKAADYSEIALALRLELLDGRGFSEQVYLDKQGRVLKRLLRREGVYIFERTDADTVLKQFPERAEYILKRSRLL